MRRSGLRLVTAGILAATDVILLLSGTAAAQQMTIRIDAVEILKSDGSSGTSEKFFDMRAESMVTQSLKVNVTASQFGCIPSASSMRINLTAATPNLLDGENVTTDPTFVDLPIPAQPAFVGPEIAGGTPYYAEKGFKLKVLEPPVNVSLERTLTVTGSYGGGMPEGCGSAGGGPEGFGKVTGKLELRYRVDPVPGSMDLTEELPDLRKNETSQTNPTPGFEPLLLLGPLAASRTLRRA
ncbi:MAG: hypothetical protein HY556_08935 [Euryarchaeota archaeon]|nr:hypothetical protein [Euryarchaeota archaeon]